MAVIDSQVQTASIAIGDSRSNQANFIWPTGIDATGNFIISVTTDALMQVEEYQTADAETDNTSSIAVTAGPDIVVKDITLDRANYQAGDKVTLSWTESNQGNMPVPTNYQSRVTVRQKNADGSLGQVIIDTSLAFNDNQLAANEHKNRQFSFSLPEGLKGSGDFVVSVTADSTVTGAGLIFEVNTTNTAELNNTQTSSLHADTRPYADLTVSSIAVPTDAKSGYTATVSWTITNQGEKDTSTQKWVDRVILVRNGNSLQNGTVLAQMSHDGGLAKGQSYSQSSNVLLPRGIEGDYQLVIITDVNHSELEPDTLVNNTQMSAVFAIKQTYVDLLPTITTISNKVEAGRSASITWQITNQGTIDTNNSSYWVDSIYLSKTGLMDNTAILVGSKSHTGQLAIGANYQESQSFTVPNNLLGDYYVIVVTDVNQTIYEPNQRGNNTVASIQPMTITAEPYVNLTAENLVIPATLPAGNALSFNVDIVNAGTDVVNASTYHTVTFINTQNPSQRFTQQLPIDSLVMMPNTKQTKTYRINPPLLANGSWQMVLDLDTSGYIKESKENDNQISANFNVIAPDLQVANITTTGILQGGETVQISWDTLNKGGQAANNIIDRVYLTKNDTLGSDAILLKEISQPHIDANGKVNNQISYDIPLQMQGDWSLMVITDASNTINENGADNNNQLSQAIRIAVSAYADLTVTKVEAPNQTIADPATLTVNWTVSNQGLGMGKTLSWTDSVIYSANDTLGDSDDIVLGTKTHQGGLATNESYSDSLTYQFGPNFTRHGKIFVKTDSQSQVWENGLESNNVTSSNGVDVMPIAYADLTVDSIATSANALSGQPLEVTWQVTNRGIGITNTNQWGDSIWLTDSSGKSWGLGSVTHLGVLNPNDSYRNTVRVTLPNGLSGNYTLHIKTEGPFEFTHTDNNTKEIALPITLSPSPDLVVSQISLPQAASEGDLIQFSWQVKNQGTSQTVGGWEDEVRLVSTTDANKIISLGSYKYTEVLEAGKSYTREEQIRLPLKIQGLWRLEVVTNKTNSLYENADALKNNQKQSDTALAISLLPRPDLRVTEVELPEAVTAGTRATVKFVVANTGSIATNKQWQDGVYLSLDGTLSADDRLIGRINNPVALSPTETYSSQSSTLDIPISYRGDVYVIVVADDSYALEEYPNENNNHYIKKLHVDGVPFADLVTSNVVAPEQIAHGSTVEVTYQVTNKGSAKTQGLSTTVDSWTDTVWLTKDPTRPRPERGDIMLGRATHQGLLDVNQDYLGKIQATIPEGTLSGKWYIQVWSDSYDVILEDTLASNLNPNDPNQLDNNNYAAQAVNILGYTPPDLKVVAATADKQAKAGENFTFSYTVQNIADAFAEKTNKVASEWIDEVWLSDTPDLSKATEKWLLGQYRQKRGLGNQESYTNTQTVTLAPLVDAKYLIVKTNVSESTSDSIREITKQNNQLIVDSLVTSTPADLQVTSITTQPDNYSGELTPISWTVTNNGGDVWRGTADWNDIVVISKYPEMIEGYYDVIGSYRHDNSQGLKSGESYTTTIQGKLPVGGDGKYYIFVISDAEGSTYGGVKAKQELTNSASLPRNDSALSYYGGKNFGSDYAGSVYEGLLNTNNSKRAELNITYREPDLVFEDVKVSNPNPKSGEEITVTWTVKNQGARETRTGSWLDGVYLSKDDALDESDYPLVDRTAMVDLFSKTKVVSVVKTDENKQVHYLQAGESYTASTTFRLPTNIGGNYKLILKTDTEFLIDSDYSHPISSIRPDLVTIRSWNINNVPEFKDEGNNIKAIDLPITFVTPPDLQVSTVTTNTGVMAGQQFNVNYQVVNRGGDVPSDQYGWYDKIYLSKDRFLDTNKDTYLGYVSHNGGLAKDGSYEGSLSVKAPIDFSGEYYVFVVTDAGDNPIGRVREFEGDSNNDTAAEQPILITLPPPADLVVNDIKVPVTSKVGDEIAITYTVTNQAKNQAHGSWSDAVYLSSDNSWGKEDILLGHVTHTGGLAAGAQYEATLKSYIDTYGKQVKITMPPLKEGNWHIIVRPDAYNEVYEGQIRYTETGLISDAAEANNVTSSASTIAVTVPSLTLGTTQALTLVSGETKLYKLNVQDGETLRILLNSATQNASNEVYVRYGDIPSGYNYDAAYTQGLSANQSVVVPTTKAGDYYILVKARETGKDEQPITQPQVTLVAEAMPLSITKVTPDQGGRGDDAHRWVTMDIYGTKFAAGAVVKISRPGVFEMDAERWQVIDATHIRAIFDLRQVPMGLYDIVVKNPNGETVTEAYRYLVERMIEPDVTIGIGGSRSLSPGDKNDYTVSLQSLTNVDTPYVRFDLGANEMGYSENLIEGLKLPYVIFASNVVGQPDGKMVDIANTQQYGTTPTDGKLRQDIPWAVLDNQLNTNGLNLTPGYAFDVNAGGFVGATFNVQSYPGLKEWLAQDFEGLRSKLYAIRPDWKAQNLLAGGIQDLNKISPGLAHKFVTIDDDTKLNINKKEAMALPFRFDVFGSATPLTRAEFVADQIKHAEKLRQAIIADKTANESLRLLAADAEQWQSGWLAALEMAGLLRDDATAPSIRNEAKVMSLNATLATGILVGKAGSEYKTQASLVDFFAKVQAWYGDTARWSGDPNAKTAAIDYYEERHDEDGNAVEIPVFQSPEKSQFDLQATHETYFLDFNVYAGSQSEMEYLRHIGQLDKDFRPIGPKALSLTQYLQQIGQTNTAAVSVTGPKALANNEGVSFLPSGVGLPFQVNFNNTTSQGVKQIRLVTQLDPNLDPYRVRLQDMKIGDINIHLPGDKSTFQGDFDFTATKGYIVRVSAGVDAASQVITWLIQAIDPNTGSVIDIDSKALLAKGASGFVGYTVVDKVSSQHDALISSQARVLFDKQIPIDSNTVSYRLDKVAPQSKIIATSRDMGNMPDAKPSFEVQWQAVDSGSGVKHVTVYVAKDGGDFRIWQKQSLGDKGQAIFTGEAGSHYEFLAVATDLAGNQEQAQISNAVLPDDGSQASLLQQLGIPSQVEQSQQTPTAPQDRKYDNNTLFTNVKQGLPGFIADKVATGISQAHDLQSVLAPFALRGFASGFAKSDVMGSSAMVQLNNGQLLVSGGELRNAVYQYDGKEGGYQTKPLFTLAEPIVDMAVDKLGQLWVMTGRALLLVDSITGAIIDSVTLNNQAPLTHTLAIEPTTGKLYVSSGDGIEIYDPAIKDKSKAWSHFSNYQVRDLAFGPDGRLWGVQWDGKNITDSQYGSTQIVSFPMSGREMGRAQLEYSLSGVVDSIAFGQAGSELAGLLIASSQTGNVASNSANKNTAVTHSSNVWMINLNSREVVSVAKGGTRAETVLTTQDGRILVAQTSFVDEIAPLKAPKVVGSSISDGELLPLPVNQITVSFDQVMWTGSNGQDTQDPSSVLNPNNYRLVSVSSGSSQVINPSQVTWNEGSKSVVLSLGNVSPDQWRLEVASNVVSRAKVRLDGVYVVGFTTVSDLTNQVNIAFSDTRADRLTGTVSYDVSITNTGDDDLKGPLMLLLDPGQYFADKIADANALKGAQQGLWAIDATQALKQMGGKLAKGQKLEHITVSLVNAQDLSTTLAGGALVKANLAHQVYALPYANLPPVVASLSVTTSTDTNGNTTTTTQVTQNSDLAPAKVNEPWQTTLIASDSDGQIFKWSLVDAPVGMTLTTNQMVTTSATGEYQNQATLQWMPTALDMADSSILVKVVDSRGGVALKRFSINVEGGNHAVVITQPRNVRIGENQTLTLPINVSDADGDVITVSFKHLPAGAQYDASTRTLTWTPSYDQAGIYNDIEIIASDGKHISKQSFTIEVTQGYAKPVINPMPVQNLREGEAFGMQLPGFMPGGLVQADGTKVSLEYYINVLPAGMTLDSKTGWLSWTPSFTQHGKTELPIRLIATYQPADGSRAITTVANQTLVLDVANANGVPVFADNQAWQIMEGQPLRVSVFAMDPDNPSFVPKVRLGQGKPAVSEDGSDVKLTVSYQVNGLPEGASFDAETLEIIWTPTYRQAGTYYVEVTATDDGDGTGVPAVTKMMVPVQVNNANRAPVFGKLDSVIVERGSVTDIPVAVIDQDGNAIKLALSGLPSFASFTQTSSEMTPQGRVVQGVIHLAPKAGDRGSYNIGLTATDDGDGNADAPMLTTTSFVVTVKSQTEAPVIVMPSKLIAVAGQKLSLPVMVSDLDQDKLNYVLQGLPSSAKLTQGTRYGEAMLEWTPTAAEIGAYHASLVVTDSGLPAENSGYAIPEQPVANITSLDFDIEVKASNTAPDLLTALVNGNAVDASGTAAIAIAAKEGELLNVQLTARDSDGDALTWRAMGLPQGMTLTNTLLAMDKIR